LTQNTNRHAKHGNNLLTQRRNIKQKKPKGSKYYHLDDDDDNDVIDVNTDQHNATEEMRNDPTSLPNTTITTSTSKTISDVTPASSPTITVPISSVNASTRKSAGSYAPVIKQTMKKSMDASTKDKLSKKQTMTTSKKNYPTKSPKNKQIYNDEENTSGKKGDMTTKQMDTKGKKENAYFVERTRNPTTSTLTPMIPPVAHPPSLVPRVSTSSPTVSNKPTLLKNTATDTPITTFVPVDVPPNHPTTITFSPIPPLSPNAVNTSTILINNYYNSTFALTNKHLTNVNPRTGSSSIDIVLTTQRRNHSVSSLPNSSMDHTIRLFRQGADP
jgi:hypothetical protein